MAKSFEQSKDEVVRLVKHFETNSHIYRETAYKEAHARQEFIDPFFLALGWDVHNENGTAPDYREVVIEDSVEIEGQRKAPDYVFRVGRDRKFFVEAKKPGVDIKNSSSPAYQLRRYAWSAKLPLSLLTDFEELAVYDCRYRPSDKDKASAARINYILYNEYSDRWREVFDIFSRDAVWSGAYDSFARDGKKGRGTSEVDSEFLKEIELWRDLLAKNIAIRNEKLSIDELNDAVQKTIDRIVFLRMAEDRKIEEYGRLERLAEQEYVYKSLLGFFKKADERYNSGLFDFSKDGDRITQSIDIDDKVLSLILAGLYYPKSPYEFSVLPVETLGNIYEQFLGKVIRLTEVHHAKVEEKPEVKKAGGVYYTPSYIVDYIVKHTVGEAVKNKDPKELAGFRALDMACGSGSFLLGAYQFMLDHYLEWYINHSPEKYERAVWQTGGIWRLTTVERKRILIEHIYGVDIDRQAVEVTKLSLLLKVLEGESDESIGRQMQLFHERVLPSLEKNIKCGNSLIGPDYFSGKLLPDGDELKRVNPFDWNAEFPGIFSRGGAEDAERVNAEGFDCVIGNPPYGAELSENERKYLEDKFKMRNTDTACLFMALALHLINGKGKNAFIVPKPFVYSSNWQVIRETIVKNLIELVDCEKVWKEVKLEQAIYFYEKDKTSENYKSSVRKNETITSIGNIHKSTFSKYGFYLNGISDSELQIGNKIISAGSFLNDFVVNQRGAMLQSKVIETKREFSVIGGKQVNRYVITEDSRGFISKKDVTDEKGFINENSILVQNIVAHIMNPVPHIKIIATSSNSFDYKSYIVLDTVNQLTNTSNLDTKFILSILNSKLISWYVYLFIFGKAIRTMHFDNFVTLRIPYAKIDFSNPSDKEKHDKMVTLVDQMLDLHRKKAAGAVAVIHESPLQRMIAATDSEIDKLVYELYGLSEEEIGIVEGK